MDIGFFINYNNQVVQLPVNPDKITVKYSGNNTTSEIIKLGEINLLKDRKLCEISFKSFFPQDDWFPAVRTRGEFKPPEFYKKFLLGIMESKKPCRLVVTGIDISMKCSIESFQYEHQAGDHEDAYYSISIKEYRDYQISQLYSAPATGTTTPNGSSASPVEPAKPAQPAEITIGCTVIANGTIYYSSYGARPTATLKNFKGKISHINKKGSYPYHVTTMSGGWKGWMSEESVVLA